MRPRFPLISNKDIEGSHGLAGIGIGLHDNSVDNNIWYRGLVHHLYKEFYSLLQSIYKINITTYVIRFSIQITMKPSPSLVMLHNFVIHRVI